MGAILELAYSDVEYYFDEAAKLYTENDGPIKAELAGNPEKETYDLYFYVDRQIAHIEKSVKMTEGQQEYVAKELVNQHA